MNMKRLKFIPLVLISLLVISCSLGKRLSLLKKSAPQDQKSTALEKSISEHEGKPEKEATSYLSIGLDKLRNHENEAAISEFKKALILDPANAEAYYYLGLAQQGIEHFDDAIESYRAALRNNPSFYEAIFNLSAIYSAQKKYDLALEQFNAALGIRSDDAELHYNMALCLEHRGQSKEAVLEYQKACQLDPSITDAYMQLANIFELEGNLPEAINEYQKILKIADGSPDSEIARQKIETLSAQIQAEKVKQVEQAQKEEKITKVEDETKSHENLKEGIEKKPSEKGKLNSFLKMSKTSLAKVVAAPKNLYQKSKKLLRSGEEAKAQSNEAKKSDPFIRKFRLGLNSQWTTQKDISFDDIGEENTITSKRAIAQIGYAPKFLNIYNLKDTQFYLNIGSVSMGFDKSFEMGSQIEFKKAIALAYGAGISSNVYELSPYKLGVNLNLNFLHYAPETEFGDSGESITAKANLTEYQLAADTIYKGFSKFSPYFGLLYAKTSGNFELSQSPDELDFNETNQFGCRLGTGYMWNKNIIFTGEYRLLDENALSLLVNYAF